MPRLPEWVKVKLPGRGQFFDLRQRFGQLKLNTVCEEARCPNIAECWGGGTATFMILGDVCTRGCRFCDVSSGKSPLPPDPAEPQNVAEAVESMGLRYVVITSVDRDDMADEGAEHWVEVIGALREQLPALTVEVLTPDFSGRPELIERVGRAGAAVLGHNLETPRLQTPRVRDRRCDYDLSLGVLARYRALGQQQLVKSGMMLGLGEGIGELRQALRDLRSVGVDWVTLGQYLRPSRKHTEVQRYLPPEEFEELAAEARELGFPLVTAGPLVRSSYRAAEEGALELLAERRAARGATPRGGNTAS
jgi:lipoic acid synthetase